MSLPRTPWTWLPTLYIAEGIPYIIVTVVATIMYKRLGIGNADIAFYTSWLYLPWVIKPFWSPIVDAFATKRTWIIAMQLIIGAALGGLALTLPAPGFFKWSLAFFWLLAFSSATHDIAADGFYMLALTKKEQAFYVGIRSTFYRVAIIAGQGLLIMLAGTLELIYKPAVAWSTVMLVAAVLFLLLAAWHLASLPRTEILAECPRTANNFTGDIIKPFISFFQKPGICSALAFMLLYRLPEAFLTKITPLFLLDSVEGGGHEHHGCPCGGGLVNEFERAGKHDEQALPRYDGNAVEGGAYADIEGLLFLRKCQHVEAVGRNVVGRA